jgi:hypothetical protein
MSEEQKPSESTEKVRKPFQEWHENRNRKKIKRKLAAKARRINRN